MGAEHPREVAWEPVDGRFHAGATAAPLLLDSSSGLARFLLPAVAPATAVVARLLAAMGARCGLGLGMHAFPAGAAAAGRAVVVVVGTQLWERLEEVVGDPGEGTSTDCAPASAAHDSPFFRASTLHSREQ